MESERIAAGRSPAGAVRATLRFARLGPFVRAYLFRGVAVWIGLRVAAAFAQIPDPNPVESALILGAVGLAVVFDAKRRREDVFLANLGVPAFAIAVIAVLLPLLLEVFVF